MHSPIIILIIIIVFCLILISIKGTPKTNIKNSAKLNKQESIPSSTSTINITTTSNSENRTTTSNSENRTTTSNSEYRTTTSNSENRTTTSNSENRTTTSNSENRTTTSNSTISTNNPIVTISTTSNFIRREQIQVNEYFNYIEYDRTIKYVFAVNLNTHKIYIYNYLNLNNNRIITLETSLKPTYILANPKYNYVYVCCKSSNININHNKIFIFNTNDNNINNITFEQIIVDYNSILINPNMMTYDTRNDILYFSAENDQIVGKIKININDGIVTHNYNTNSDYTLISFNILGLAQQLRITIDNDYLYVWTSYSKLSINQTRLIYRFDVGDSFTSFNSLITQKFDREHKDINYENSRLFYLTTLNTTFTSNNKYGMTISFIRIGDMYIKYGYTANTLFNNITRINLDNLQEINIIEINGLNNPASIVFNNDYTEMYITNENANYVSKIRVIYNNDIIEYRLIENIDIGSPSYKALRIYDEIFICTNNGIKYIQFDNVGNILTAPHYNFYTSSNHPWFFTIDRSNTYIICLDSIKSKSAIYYKYINMSTNQSREFINSLIHPTAECSYILANPNYDKIYICVSYIDLTINSQIIAFTIEGDQIKYTNSFGGYNGTEYRLEYIDRYYSVQQAKHITTVYPMAINMLTYDKKNDILYYSGSETGIFGKINILNGDMDFFGYDHYHNDWTFVNMNHLGFAKQTKLLAEDGNLYIWTGYSQYKCATELCNDSRLIYKFNIDQGFYGLSSDIVNAFDKNPILKNTNTFTSNNRYGMTTTNVYINNTIYKYGYVANTFYNNITRINLDNLREKTITSFNGLMKPAMIAFNKDYTDMYITNEEAPYITKVNITYSYNSSTKNVDITYGNPQYVYIGTPTFCIMYNEFNRDQRLLVATRDKIIIIPLDNKVSNLPTPKSNELIKEFINNFNNMFFIYTDAYLYTITNYSYFYNIYNNTLTNLINKKYLGSIYLSTTYILKNPNYPFVYISCKSINANIAANCIKVINTNDLTTTTIITNYGSIIIQPNMMAYDSRNNILYFCSENNPIVGKITVVIKQDGTYSHNYVVNDYTLVGFNVLGLDNNLRIMIYNDNTDSFLYVWTGYSQYTCNLDVCNKSRPIYKFNITSGFYSISSDYTKYFDDNHYSFPKLYSLNFTSNNKYGMTLLNYYGYVTNTDFNNITCVDLNDLRNITIITINNPKNLLLLNKPGSIAFNINNSVMYVTNENANYISKIILTYNSDGSIRYDYDSIIDVGGPQFQISRINDYILVGLNNKMIRLTIT